MESTISPCKSTFSEPGPAVTRRQRGRARRCAEIQRARRNLEQGVSLVGACGPSGSSRGRLLPVCLVLAVSGHAAVALGLYVAAPERRSERAEVHVRIESRPVVAAEPLRAPSEPEVPPTASPAPPPKAEARPSPKPRRKSADTQSVPAAPASEASPHPPHPVAIVGLTLESTAAGGSGPTFAVGNALSGQTDVHAHAPNGVERVPVGGGEPSGKGSRNRVARAVAPAGVKVERARRLGSLRPDYPELLQKRGVEADVTVRVDLSADGVVEQVQVLSLDVDPGFIQAARAAAMRERFAPERHDGKPVATSLTYTYRFRITP